MYARQVDGQTLTLAVSGSLWNNSMLMYDVETKSLWTHLVGEAKSGPLKGKRLTVLPAVVTDWESWRRQHPDSTVLAFRHQNWAFNRDAFDKAELFVLGIASGKHAKVWELAGLKRDRFRNDEWLGKPVLAVFESKSATAGLYERTIKGKELHFFIEDEKIKDDETKSTWELATGKASAGPFAGQSLNRLPAIVGRKETWLRFHPPPK